MRSIQVYSTRQCPHCQNAKQLLQKNGLAYEEIDVSTDMDVMQEMIQRSGNRSVPQIFIDGNAIGGYKELALMNSVGDL